MEKDYFNPAVCLYHADCMDGFTAAHTIYRNFAGPMELVGCHHGRTPPLGVLNERLDVVIVDFSFDAKTMREIARRSKRVLVLDHHVTAKEALSEFAQVVSPASDTVHQDFEILGSMVTADQPSNLLVCFDMERSGAMMAHDFCFPGTRPSLLVQHVQDRDLWKFDLPGSKDIHLFLTTIEKTVEEWGRIEGSLEYGVEEIRAAGMSMGRYHDTIVDHIVHTSGHQSAFHRWSDVAIANAPPMFVSDVGHALLEKYPDAPFAAVLTAGNTGVSWSLRSADDRMDVAAVAREFGGGGHRNAAGFKGDG